MASSSSSAVDIPPPPKKYDVFLSLRGEDTCRTFTRHLHAALLRKKLNTYLDFKLEIGDEIRRAVFEAIEKSELERGDEIRRAVFEAIEKSDVAVIIFGKDYAFSTWCLDELVHILGCKERDGQLVIPIFYDIDPSHVRKQHGRYAEAFAKHEERFKDNMDKVRKWRDALGKAANLSGFDYSNKTGTAADFIEEVVQYILTKLDCKWSSDLKGLVGIERQNEEIESPLRVDSPDVCTRADGFAEYFQNFNRLMSPEFKMFCKNCGVKGHDEEKNLPRNSFEWKKASTEKKGTETYQDENMKLDKAPDSIQTQQGPEEKLGWLRSILHNITHFMLFKKLNKVPDPLQTQKQPVDFKDSMKVSYANVEKKTERAVEVVDEEYASLPAHLKGLFLYCSLFPSSYEYRKDELVRLWVAEGFIGESQIEKMEDTGTAYFAALEDKGFLVPSRCDFTVDFDSVFSIPIYQPNNFFYKINPNKLSILENTISGGDYLRATGGMLDGCSKMTQHLSLICEDINEMTFEVLQKFKHLCTLLVLSGRRSSTKKIPHSLFVFLKVLRTLNLSGTLISELPSSIGNVKTLRYLDVSNTSITLLPESIDSLHSLQTLKLRGCTHFVQLPKDMKMLTNLRHIELDILRQLVSMPAHLGKLTKLQTLSAFLVGRDDGCRIGELKNLNDLKGALRISKLENVLSREEAREAALIDKKCLQRLELRWSNFLVENAEQEEILQYLQPHSGLQELQIMSYGGSIFPTWISSPYLADLVVLTLYRCKSCKLLPSIGELPALKFLSVIEMNEVKAIDHQFFRNGSVDNEAFHAFPKLEILEVDIMLKLEEWTELQLGDLPSLVKLTVNCCPELVTLPSLSCLKLLKHLEFRRCPKLLTLPSNGLPTSLEAFIVIDCPELKELYRKGEGEDWSKIRHVPEVWFDHEEASKI